ncbi:MAG: LuxR C-terminal-related transcriptional regulator, partial [Terracoccus sp.]
VLHATGVRAESHIAFAGLGALLRPLETLVPKLAREQARAVAVVFGQVARVTASELVLGAACLRLIALAAEQSPVVLVADDVQWFDEESWRAVSFVVRRISGEPIGAILAGRPDGHRVDGLPTLLIKGLDLEAATAMLQRACPELATDVCRQLHRRTGGNPLALVEAVEGLDPAQRYGAQELPEDLPTSQDLTSFFSSRAASCSPDTQRLLLLSALEGRGDLGVLSAAAQREGLDLSLLDPAERAGLVTVAAQRLTFRHPLVQEAVLHSATPAQRRAAHSALVDALAPDRTRAAWHAAAACVGPDTQVADALAGVAARADAAGATTSASIAFERASMLTPDVRLRAHRLLLAAEAALAAGTTKRAITLAVNVPPDLLAETDQGRPALVRGRGAMLLGRTGEAGPLLLEAACTLVPVSAAEALAEAVKASIDGGDLDFARLVVARAEALAPENQSLLHAFHVRRARSALLEFSGDLAGAVRLIHEAINALNDSGAVSDDPATWLAMAFASVTVGDVIEGRRLFALAAAHARGQGDLPQLVDALYGQSFVARMTGQWASAYATGTRALELLDEDRSPYQLAGVLQNLAGIDAARGNEALCRQRCQQTRRLAATHGLPLLTLMADRAEALLDLGLNHLDAAETRLRRVLLLQQQLRVPVPFYSPIPDLAEVCARLGKLDDGQELIGEFESMTGAGTHSQPRARLLRTRALVAPRDQYRDLFEESVALDAESGMDFLRARTLLCFGERLRRENKRAQARAPLVAALQVFDSVDAAPWSRRARVELAATGGQVAEQHPSGIAALTPQELQIAVLVTQGKRNKEIAATLYLSLRTIEFHLTGVFRKLGVSNRTAVASRLASGVSASLPTTDRGEVTDGRTT